MKLFALTFFAIVFGFRSIGQKAIIDSLNEALVKEKTDTGKAIILYNLSYYYQMYKPDSALLLAEEAYTLSEKNDFLTGESWALNQMAGAFNRLGNYPKALEYYIEQLKIEEKRTDPETIASIYMNIALVYNSEKDPDKALFYAYKADSIVKRNNLPVLSLYTLLNIGDIYEKSNKLDSASFYTAQCYIQAVKQKNDLITGTALNNLGNIYSKSGKLRQALNSYKNSVPYLEAMRDYNTLAECKLGLARVYEETGLDDSAYYYANESFQLASKNEFLKHALNASALLSRLYKKKGNLDSAFAYQETLLSLKDSIYSLEKIEQLQSLTIAEQLRQKQIAEIKLQENEDRRKKLQLLAIGIFIPICFFISVYLSRKKVHKKVIEFSGVVSLLLLFEYITLFIDPLVSEKAHHSPIVEIIIFVGIAAFITPTHHKIEELLIARLSKIHHTHSEARLKALKEKASHENKPE
jgi:tetratricopeptide (TPR) repeat protein